MNQVGPHEAVERTRRVPVRFKVFDRSVEDARKAHGIDHSTLDGLVGLGLEHRGTGSGRRFDNDDLTNVALALGYPTSIRQAMKWWPQTLRYRTPDDHLRRRLQLSARCPEPGHDGRCEFRVNPLVTLRAEPGSFRQTRDAVFIMDVRLDARERFLDARYAGYVERMSAIEFQFLPPALWEDVAFVEATGLADCQLAARFGARLATSMGLPARENYGYFLAGPFLYWHNWVEFQVDEEQEWVAADPLWLSTLARWGVGGSECWPAHRSPAPLLWHPYGTPDDGGGDPSYLIEHNGAPVRPTITSAGLPD